MIREGLSKWGKPKFRVKLSPEGEISLPYGVKEI